MPQTRVRPAEMRDADVIVEFNRHLARETEALTLDREVLARGVASVLADPAKGRYFLAVNDDGDVLGQLMITYEWSDWRNGMIWWLQSVYVREDARRQGVFRTLLTHVREQARNDHQVVGIRLYVEEGNERAQASYQAAEFRNAGYWVMQWLQGEA